MVRCQFCFYYTNGMCNKEGAPYYGKQVPNESIECNHHIDTSIVAGSMFEPDIYDTELFNMGS